MSANEQLVIAPPPVTPDQLALVKQTVAQGATDAELKLYLYDCARQGVHPLDRLLHFTKRGGKYTPITSIDLMRTRAADTGEYAGSDDADFRDTQPGDGEYPGFIASVTVWRLVQGQRCPFTATARLSEYAPTSGQDHMWRKMPHTMLAKCAEALALRKGFPRQLAGLYAKEEMDQAGPDIQPPDPRHEALKPANVPTPQPVTASELPPSLLISAAQVKRFHAIKKAHGWTDEAAKGLVKNYGFSSSSDITKATYEQICAALEAGPVAAEPMSMDDLMDDAVEMADGE